MAQRYNKKEVKKKLAEGRLEDFEFPPKEKFPSKFNKGVAFTRVNFNSPLFWGGILGGKMIFIDCSFEDCNLDGINGRRVVFENCSFKNCILAKEDYSKFYKSSFKNCVFEENTILGILITDCSIENCKFLERSVDNVWLRDCDLKSVIFCGRYFQFFVFGCTLNDVDFSNALLTKVSFYQCSVSSASFPDSPDCFCIDPSIFEKAKSIL
ncbi:MAG: pentapeptide repeat-containing protein, partial [Methanobacteriota archaeon]